MSPSALPWRARGRRTHRVTLARCAVCAACMLAAGCAAPAGRADAGAGGAPPPARPSVPGAAEEAPILTSSVQLTSRERFVKAGESYFSPDGSRIVFQAVEAGDAVPDAEQGYAMFVADVVRRDGVPVALEGIRRISPQGSANTCGWFHPRDSGTVIFGSTLEPPKGGESPGYQRGTGRYRWAFPPEMRIVQLRLDDPGAAPVTVAGDGSGYVAEGSVSPDGTALLFTRVDPVTQGDLWVKDLASGEERAVVVAPGYDGGPFFSPDGRSIIYRSDRRNDNLLQLYTADVVRDAGGRITGVAAERALTANGHVNWCPYYHPSGSFAAYATSEVGHDNYEVFLVDVRDPSRRVRVTHAPGADVLPAFSSDGRTMVWTSKRDGSGSSQLWCASFDGDAARAALEAHVAEPAAHAPPAQGAHESAGKARPGAQ